MKTAILGAGISGLALARILQERGLPIEDLTLFEAKGEVGGLCRSKSIEGFTYDIAGGHILFSKDQGIMQWLKDCAGGDDAFVKRDRNTKIRFEDRWVHYPFENGLGDLPDQAKYDCLKGYVHAWHERTASGTEAPGDFKSWIQWRFGDGIAKHFMDPYNEKIWERPLEQITSGWVAGRVPDAPVEDVLKSAIGIRTEGYTHQAIFYYPKKGGFQPITDGLATTLMDRIRLNTPVETLTRNGDTWKVNGEEFDVVVNTLPLDFLPQIVEGIPADVTAAMNGLAFNSVRCYLIALSREEHPDLSWIYLPHHEQGPVNRVTYLSNYSPGNAPEGKTSFLAEVTYDGRGPAPKDEVVDDVVNGMVYAGLMSKDEILFTDHTQCSHAYIVYDHDLDERREMSIDWCEKNNLLPLGRFGHYDYHNSDQCVIASREMAERLIEMAEKG